MLLWAVIVVSDIPGQAHGIVWGAVAAGVE